MIKLLLLDWFIAMDQISSNKTFETLGLEIEL